MSDIDGKMQEYIDSLTRTDIIDLNPVITDLKHVVISESERALMGEMDAAAMYVNDGGYVNPVTGQRIPLGKLVL